MKKTTKKLRLTLSLLTTISTLSSASAQVSNEDFIALKKTVEQLAEKVQKLEQTHATDTQTHQQDAAQIQQLRDKLDQTQRTVTSVEQKALAATPAQPLPRVPIDEATVNHNFMILGDAEFQYAKTSGQRGAFLLADFAPIFLYRGGSNVLFEAGFDFTLQNIAPAGSGYNTAINLSFAQLDYVMNDYATFVAGNMVLPLGTYSERTAGWLNKFPDDPLARDLLPGSGVGVELRGAAPLGDSGKLFNYAVYGVNGPSSADGTGNAGALDLGGNVGLRSDNAVANLHGRPVGGARMSLFLPFKPHYDLEVGLSGQSGQWDNAGSHLWSAGVADWSLHLGPSLEVKGEYVQSRYGSDDLGQIRPKGWWTQVGYKLAGLNLELPVVNNLELVGRYDSAQDGLGTSTHRYSAGYVYYISNTLLFEGDYEFVHSTDVAQNANQLILQLSYGF